MIAEVLTLFENDCSSKFFLDYRNYLFQEDVCDLSVHHSFKNSESTD